MSRRRWIGIAAGIVAVCAVLAAIAAHGPGAAQFISQEVEEFSDKLDVPFVASHESVLDTMFDLAKVTKDDFIVDLGSGDGRIVITAAKRFGARGFGVDLNEQLVAMSNEWAQEEGIADRAKFYVRDLFQTDFSQATVLTMYLLPHVVLKLRPKLLSTLAPDTRIVSHDYDLGAWQPDESREVERDWISRSVVHFWVVPADVGGTWTWTTPQASESADDAQVTARIAQRFQVVRGKVKVNERSRAMRNVRLRGRSFRFTFPGDGEGAPKAVYEGTVAGDTITGTVRYFDGDREVAKPWRAARQSGGGQLAR